jgi:hypothetical protein
LKGSVRASARKESPTSTSAQLLLVSQEIINRPLPEGVLVFASGMNRVADIRGAAVAGVPIGVDVSRLSNAAIDELLRHKLPLLLDSGAFGEVSFQNGCVQVTSEITDTDWTRRLAIYLRIARHVCRGRKNPHGVASVIAVAPDRVGSQELTLVRLGKFRSQVGQVYAAGADILVPLQVGHLSLYDFYLKAKGVLGIEVVPGFPMKKAATTAQAILDFVERTKIERVHLLGMGANHPKATSLLRLIQQTWPHMFITMDSNRIRAAVGARRIITQKEIHYRDELTAGWTGEIDLREWGGEVHDMTEAIFQPAAWLQGAQLQEVADSLTWLMEDQRREFQINPDAFVNDDNKFNDWLHQVLMIAYLTNVQRHARTSARTRAVAETLNQSKIAGQVV